MGDGIKRARRSLSVWDSASYSGLELRAPNIISPLCDRELSYFCHLRQRGRYARRPLSIQEVQLLLW